MHPVCLYQPDTVACDLLHPHRVQYRQYWYWSDFKKMAAEQFLQKRPWSNEKREKPHRLCPSGEVSNDVWECVKKDLSGEVYNDAWECTKKRHEKELLGVWWTRCWHSGSWTASKQLCCTIWDNKLVQTDTPRLCVHKQAVGTAGRCVAQVSMKIDRLLESSPSLYC